jgi:ferrous iron transport protein B
MNTASEASKISSSKMGTSKIVPARLALVGVPNAGKTAIFNALTRSQMRVANYSGVTVDCAEADYNFQDGHPATLIDLPGAYSLNPYTDDEQFLKNLIHQNQFDGMILVIDAAQLVRGVRFVLEVLNATTVPAVVALNMIDLAEERGMKIDLAALSESLGVPVIPTVAVKRKGLSKIADALQTEILRTQTDVTQKLQQRVWKNTATTASLKILELYKQADQIAKKVTLQTLGPDDRSRKIDQVVLHPVWGPVVLFLVLGLTFQLMFNFAQIPMDWIEQFFALVSAQVQKLPLSDSVKSFIVDGVLAGLGGTLVFLPQILILFSLILFLEDFGFMARAVFLLDYGMGRLGLHGKAFLPLLSSFACAIPGIMATKTIERRNDRIATILILPITTCSARIPVYALLISAFIPNVEVWGWVKLHGLIMLALYAVGIAFALLVGFILKRFFLKGQRPPLLMELPSYKWPSVSGLFKALVYRAQLFLVRVGTIILALTVLVWFSVSYPQAPEGAEHPIEYSYAAKMGHAIEPILKPLGFDWKIGMALIPAFAAREVMVTALSTAYAVDSQVSADAGEEQKTEKLSEIIRSGWSFATGMSLLVWFIFAPQCISTLAVARRELQSTSWTLVMFVYLTALAYLMSFLTYRFFSAVV